MAAQAGRDHHVARPRIPATDKSAPSRPEPPGGSVRQCFVLAETVLAKICFSRTPWLKAARARGFRPPVDALAAVRAAAAIFPPPAPRVQTVCASPRNREPRSLPRWPPDAPDT